uniref:Uncharacterized protein n=1 Tax=Falco tinnunculus TaxID=100819 RepID=A0A8C4XNP6_FALTI
MASYLPLVPITHGIIPAPCAHCPWHHTCPLCPSPMALCLPLVPITHGVVPAACPHPKGLCTLLIPCATSPAPRAHPRVSALPHGPIPGDIK